MDKLITIGRTGLEVFKRCPRMYYLSQVLRLRSVYTPRPLRFGLAFHASLEAWWSCEDKDARLRGALEAWNPQKYNLSSEDDIIGQILLRRYTDIYGHLPLPANTTPEKKLVVPILGLDGEPTGMLMKCTLDTIGDDVAFEHKSTSSADIGEESAYRDRIDYGMQAPIQFIVATDSGNELTEIQWDVIRAPELRFLKATPLAKQDFYKRGSACAAHKPKITEGCTDCKHPGDPKPSTRLADETPSEFIDRVDSSIRRAPHEWFQRYRITKTPEQLDEVRYDMLGYAQQIRLCHETGVWPRNTEICNDLFNRECEFKPACFQNVDPTTSELYVVETSYEFE